MSAAHNKALIGRYYEKLWNRWDFALANEIIGEAIVFRGSLGVSVAGRKGFINDMGTVQRAFPDFHNRIEELIAENDRVATRLTFTGTHQGEVLGIAPTGRQVSYAGVALFRISEGRVIEGWVMGDVLGLARQLGDERTCP
jgi:steroid delta-isomerase-like uncharacterized protein